MTDPWRENKKKKKLTQNRSVSRLITHPLFPIFKKHEKKKKKKRGARSRIYSTRSTRTKLDRKQGARKRKYAVRFQPCESTAWPDYTYEGGGRGKGRTRAYQAVRGPRENECLLTSWKLKILRGLCGAISRANIHRGTTGAQCPSGSYP